MKLKTIKIGDCFCLEDNHDRKWAFIAFEIIGKQKVKFVKFIPVLLTSKKNLTIDLVNSGKVFTSQVYNMKIEDYETGIFTTDFYEEDVDILEKLKPLGNIKLDHSKFTWGGGSGGGDYEMFLMQLHALAIGYLPQFRKKPLKPFISVEFPF